MSDGIGHHRRTDLFGTTAICSLASVVFIHEAAELIVIVNASRAGRRETLNDRKAGAPQRGAGAPGDRSFTHR
ncbi:hypothetical protein HQ346_19730 [Rhodococcus sp. BP-252]|uniref:hypothetical protein n=1 Tax=unclassified Rhodococcus (in: high G+C Gram-positive bacteria) TaxID=192944 RepID=UPI001C9A7905|nr:MULTISPECIES: hypothetical protein [unclassified Rhodococcus (in: high G+C Gram-positive bacteria)]MBY6413929.1 hypothetical protein [Rhodococcus sp. BP-320]MBY6418621.1 hypothetical protein [Rhodococcus sp. BP-321]MBY6422916.1 hypothetical protein [Rhodococcus sp. BP-324]MBY6428735.1 hypothetical protein [Rhodococcus sp. BP-323]MBY6433742.1 hypothetical protein [Rhodococcus sp. BP-322]